MKLRKLHTVKKYGIGIVLAIVPFLLLAAPSIVTCGNDGQPPCAISDGFPILGTVFRMAVGLTLLFSFASLAGYGAILFLSKGDSPQAIKDFSQRFISTVVYGALLAGSVSIAIIILTSLGTDEKYIEIFKKISEASSFVEHAYAQGASPSGLPQPIKIDNPYDYAILLFSMFFRWVALPGAILLWTYSAFLLVFAQGAPEGIKKAKTMLWSSLVFTVILFLLQGFLYALRATLGT